MPSSVFLSYRRMDAAGYARSLYDRLNSRFPGQVFMDWSGIEGGANYVHSIQEEISSCRVLLALIGKHWLAAAGSDGRRRLDDPDDLVRREIAGALGRDALVVPVLLEGAAMPDAGDLPPGLATLAQRQAIELSDARWDHDCDRLLEIVERALVPRGRRRARRRLLAIGFAAILAIVGGTMLYKALHPAKQIPQVSAPPLSAPSTPASASTGDPSIDALIKAGKDASNIALGQLASRNAGQPAPGYSPGVGFEPAGKWLVNMRPPIAGSMLLDLKADHNFSISQAADALKILADQLGGTGTWTFDVKTGRLVLLPGSGNLALGIYIAGKEGRGFSAMSPDGVQFSFTHP
jgi:TIR domain